LKVINLENKLFLIHHKKNINFKVTSSLNINLESILNKNKKYLNLLCDIYESNNKAELSMD
jgi:hypothetical protein